MAPFTPGAPDVAQTGAQVSFMKAPLRIVPSPETRLQGISRLRR